MDDALVTLLPGESRTFRVTRRDGHPLPPDAADALTGTKPLDAAVRSIAELTG